MLKDMKIGPRLIAAFMVLVLISTAVGIVGLFAANRIDDMANEMYANELLGLSHIKEANISLIAVSRDRSNFLLATSQGEREKHLASIKKHSERTREFVEKAKPLFVTDRAKEIFASYAQVWDEYQSEMQRAM